MSKSFALFKVFAVSVAVFGLLPIKLPVTAKTALPQKTICQIAKDKVESVTDEASYKLFLIAIGLSEEVAQHEATSVVTIDHTPWSDVRATIHADIASECN